MIKIAKEGNTIIQIAAGGSENGDPWTVYPYLVPDPTFQKFDLEQQNKIKELSVTGFRDKEDLSGHRMNADLAEAIWKVNFMVGQDRFRDLGLVIDKIDVDPKSEIVGILGKEHNIRPIIEGQDSLESKG